MRDVALLPTIPDYVIEEPLGRGLQSRVYRAIQSSLGRQVAIKLLQNFDADDLVRFEREAEIMAKLTHPNLVSVIDRGTVDGRPYFVMEYMEGGSLRERFRAGEPMNVESALQILSAMAAGISALHGKGLIHRDIKPDNVLFNRQDHVKVADFGIAVSAEQLGRLTQGDAAPGTIDYMAPEQRYRLEVTEKADQFSLAVVAYEMLTGKLPPRVFRPASQQNRLLSVQVDAVLERALQEESEGRYSNVSEFVEALDAALAVPAPRLSPPSTSPGQLRTYLPVALLGSIVAGLVYLQINAATGSRQAGVVVPGSGPASTGSTSSSAVAAAVPRVEVQQTGALPFRVDDSGTLEILLVTARSGNHWTIPKANQTGKVSRVSIAEEEAFEEAGVLGTGFTESAGLYTYCRSHKRYIVTVIPVLVHEELVDWPEKFRQRKWIPLQDAEGMIPSDGLREIVSTFSPPHDSQQ